MARPATELTRLLDPHDPEKSAARLRREGCLAEGAAVARAVDVIAGAYSAARDREGASPLHDAADALGKSGVLSAKGSILWRKIHEPPPWWKFWA